MKRIALAATCVVVSACQLFSGSDSVAPDAPGDDADPSGDVATNVLCSSTLSSSSFINVTVPVGARCDLFGVTLSGNVQVLQDARLYMTATDVKGDVQGEKASLVHIRGGTVGGNIRIVDGNSPDDDGVSITEGTRVDNGNIHVQKMKTRRVVVSDAIVVRGNVQIKENSTSHLLEVTRNQIQSGSLEVVKNSGVSAKIVVGNSVEQKLECKENSFPFIGAYRMSPIKKRGNAGEEIPGVGRFCARARQIRPE